MINYQNCIRVGYSSSSRSSNNSIDFLKGDCLYDPDIEVLFSLKLKLRNYSVKFQVMLLAHKKTKNFLNACFLTSILCSLKGM